MTLLQFYYYLLVTKLIKTCYFQNNLTIEDEMQSRADVMKQACQKHGLDQPGNDSLHNPYPWEYLINEEHHLVWCNIFKSGSTR